MNVLEINSLQKSFDGRTVLRDISLSVAEGEVVAVIGPSGSGKSTLLRCATLLETMDGGALRYLGRAAAQPGPDGKTAYADAQTLKEIRSTFGLVFQSFNLFPHYSVLRNIIDAPVCVQKRSPEEATKTAMALLQKMGLADRGAGQARRCHRQPAKRTHALVSGEAHALKLPLCAVQSKSSACLAWRGAFCFTASCFPFSCKRSACGAKQQHGRKVGWRTARLRRCYAIRLRQIRCGIRINCIHKKTILINNHTMKSIDMQSNI